MKRDYVATLWKEMPENANETPSSAESSDSFADLKTASDLVSLIKMYPPTMLDVTGEIDELADVYIAEAVVPEKKRDDALHIAIATVYEMDALVSWNYKHLANLSKKEKVRAVSILQGYLKELEMITHMEVIDDE